MNELKELIAKQEAELRGRDRIETCDYSCLPTEGRLWCDNPKRPRNLLGIRAYCQTCRGYTNEELGIIGVEEGRR